MEVKVKTAGTKKLTDLTADDFVDFLIGQYYVTEELIDAFGQGRVSFKKEYTVNQMTKQIYPPKEMTYAYDADTNQMVLSDYRYLKGLGFKCTLNP